VFILYLGSTIALFACFVGSEAAEIEVFLLLTLIPAYGSSALGYQGWFKVILFVIYAYGLIMHRGVGKRT